MPSGPTPSQTVGPYFHLGLAWKFQPDVAPPGVAGERVVVAGRVLDGDGQPVPDAMIEIWQADAEGRYPHPEDPRWREVDPRFRGFGRVPTDAAGAFRIATVKPGRVPGPGGRLQAPHLVVSVFMRGLLKRLVTRMYFPDDAANLDDPALAAVEPARRGTLVARRGAGGPGSLEWDVVLQGESETVFFDC
ncbi:MAG TPA: protocatechuate 3,4-dioxygenase subunit alpha [Anaeromyxobacter sp.]